MFENHLRKSDILSKNAGLPQVFFKHFASKNQLPGLPINGTLVANGLIKPSYKTFNFFLYSYFILSQQRSKQIHVQKTTETLDLNNRQVQC